MKNLYKIRLQIFLKLVANDIKILSPGGFLPLTHSYIHLLNHEKMCIKSEVEEMFFKLATNDQSDAAFLLTSNLWPQGCLLLPGLYTYIKS